MPTMVKCKCDNCGAPMEKRLADRKRGWGMFCSKSCKAIKQEKRTGQHAAYLNRQIHSDDGYMHPHMGEGEVQ